MLQSVNLGDAMANVDPAQVCRTCTHHADHAWRIPFDLMLELRDTPALDRLLCQPDRCDIPLVATSQGLLPVEDEHDESFGMVASCGQQLLAKCTTCARFNAVRIDVPYQLYEGGPTRFRPLIVGGHCSIPAEGIVINGKTTFCDHQRRHLNIDASCLNCQFRMQTGPNTWGDDFDRNVANLDLTPFEMHQARLDSLRNDKPIAFAITDARIAKLNDPVGVHRWYAATLLERITRPMTTGVRPEAKITDGNVVDIVTQEVVIGYRVRFIGTGDERVIDVDDENVQVHDFGSPTLVALEIRLPHQADFGYLSSLKVSRVKYPTLPDSLDMMGAPMEFRPPAPHYPGRIDPNCARCEPQLARACHYHSLQPKYNLLHDAVEFADPHGCEVPLAVEVARGRAIHLRYNAQGHVRIVDDEGRAPHPTVFATRFRHLLRHARNHTEWSEIMQAYHAIVDPLPHTMPRNVEVGYGAPQSMEPFKSYCSLNLRHEEQYMRNDGTWVVEVREGVDGLDFRAEFGDEFGVRFTPQGGTGGRLYRADDGRSWVIPYPDRSWAEWMDREEYLRAMVNERQFSPAQVQLEELTNLELMEDQGPKTPLIGPIHWKVTRLDIFGEPAEDHDAYDPVQERHEYRRLMDESRQIEHNDAMITVSEMMRRHGIHYAMGSRGQVDPSIIFDQVEITSEDAFSAYVCVRHPDIHRFSPEKIDFGDFQCPICDDADVLWHESSHEDLPARPARTRKGRTGIGLAMAVDRPSYQEQTRLIGMKCENWMLRGSNVRFPVTLDRLSR